MIEQVWKTRHIAALTALFVAAGCGGGGDAGGSGGGGGGGGAAVESPVDPATVGHASGMVTFSGMAPAMELIDLSGESVCAERHPTGAADETVVVGDGGGLANTFVYVKEGLEGMEFPTPSSSVVLDQDGCIYTPHVLGVQAGQDITLRNSDGILHNINASPTENRPFNVSQPVVMDTNRSFAVAEVMVPVRCDVHGWMSAYIGVLDHPYHTVSGPDGSVSLEGLPPGDYVIEAWHEMYGTLTANVTVATGATAEFTFEFSSDMAGADVPMGEPIDLAHPEGHRTVEDR